MNNFRGDFSTNLKNMPFICFSSFRGLLSSLLHILLFKLNPFFLELGYFITLSSLGFLALKSTKPRTSTDMPNDIDLFFTSVSASTVSSMSTVEMEVFSNTQLVFLTVLMLIGGEVFTSMLGLHLVRARKGKTYFLKNHHVESSSHSGDARIELGTVRVEKSDPKREIMPMHEEFKTRNLKLRSLKTLAYLVSCYLLVVHAIGTALVSIYFSFVPGAKGILNTKGIKLQTFAAFTTVSTFSNCGFIPTNENMVVFKNYPGLLLILIPQILMGNTMYPVFLRLWIFFAEKTTRRAEYGYMLRSSRELGYAHLVPGLDTVYLGLSAVGLIVVQMVVFCSLDWNLKTGLTSVYEKVVGIVFQVVNSRHSGESVFDLSAVAPAVLVVFVLMMYLPPYTYYLPIDQQRENTLTSIDENDTRKNNGFSDHVLFSQLTYLVIFITLICITERHEMKRDPLNFNVLSIVVEVVSAYGNVGFSLGYSCERQINPDGHCKDAWYGLAGKWSNGGKFLLIAVMFIGKLKKYNRRGGRAWSLA